MVIWKKIPNFSRYEASTDGQICSINYKNSGKRQIIKPALAKDGYLQTMLQDDNGKYHSWKIHKFMEITFLGEQSGLEVNHKDGNKTNNAISNLEYCTRSENILHAYKHRLIVAKRGSLNGMAKLTEQDVKEIRETAKKGGRYYGRKALAAKYGVSEAHIKDIVTVRRGIWKQVI